MDPTIDKVKGVKVFKYDVNVYSSMTDDGSYQQRVQGEGISCGVCAFCGQIISKDPHSVCQWQMAAEVRRLEKEERITLGKKD